MPELPEVETVLRGLIPVLQGKVIEEVELYRPDLRYSFPPLFSDRLKGSMVNRLERRAKYLLLHLDSMRSLIIHLGMSARLRICKEEGFNLLKHDHVVFRTNQNDVVAYNDARRFGLMELIPTDSWEEHPFFASLGFEPFAENLTASNLNLLLKRRTQPIKIALMDQRLIVGVGNIYASESLWKSRIHPARSAASLSITETEILLENIRSVLRDAIQAGGSTLRDHYQPNGQSGYFQFHFSVYDRESQSCRREACKGYIKKMTQGGRSTYFCEECQS